MGNPHHCVHSLLPPVKSCNNYLRPKVHILYELPRCDSGIHRKSFLPRCLLNYVWCVFFLYAVVSCAIVAWNYCTWNHVFWCSLSSWYFMHCLFPYIRLSINKKVTEKSTTSELLLLWANPRIVVAFSSVEQSLSGVKTYTVSRIFSVSVTAIKATCRVDVMWMTFILH